MDPDISRYVAREPQVAGFLKMAKEKEFDRADRETLSKLAEAAKLGKMGKLK
jgi:hypothetical protein